MDKGVFTDPLVEDNPVLTQMLGVCSALAVTTQLEAGVTMAAALTIVLTLSNVIISAMRNIIPSKIRMIAELVVIASLVILADQVLKAFLFEQSKTLSVFVGLIITNCIVMGRAEAYALGNPPAASALDGLGNGFGYGLILVIVSAVREVLGAGKFFGIEVVPASFFEMGYINMGLMVLAPGAFFLIGLIGWAQKEYLIKKGAA